MSFETTMWAALLFVAGIGTGWIWLRLRKREQMTFPYKRSSTGRWRPADPIVASQCVKAGGNSLWRLPRAGAQESSIVVFSGRTGRNPRARLSTGGIVTEHQLIPRWHGSWAVDSTLATQAADGETATLDLDSFDSDAPPELLTSKELPGPHETILILAPHPDDAELAAFGLFSTRPRQSHILTVTAGERGTGYSEKEDPSETYNRASIRVRESFEIPLVHGAVPRDNCQNLLLPDARLLELISNPSNELMNPYDRLRLARQLGLGLPPNASGLEFVNGLVAMLERVKPSIVVCPDPICDDHPDHRGTAIALANSLLSLRSMAVPRIYLYTIHSRHSDAAPFGMERQPSGPPPLLDDVPLSAFFSQTLDPMLMDRKRAALRACSDILDERFETPSAIRAGLFANRFSTNLIRRFTRSTEWFRVVNPAEFQTECSNPKYPS